MSPQSQLIRGGGWSHTPSYLIIYWILISVPLVFWDTGYILLRPHSMPGGSLHRPLWVPYALYGSVDYLYGWPAWERGDGFPLAQGILNLIENALYIWYLWLVYRYGQRSSQPGRGAPGLLANAENEGALGRSIGHLGNARVLSGWHAGVATLVAHAAAVMTLSKTLLYWLQEYCAGWHYIGHNSANRLLFLWIIPNGAWLVFPAYMVYIFTQEILEGLYIATGKSSQLASPQSSTRVQLAGQTNKDD